MSRRASSLLLLAALAPTLGAQVGQDELDDNPVPDFVAALSFLSLDESITGASWRIESDSEFADDTTFSTIKLPWEHDFDVGSELGTLFVEASAGYLSGDDHLSVPTDEGEVTMDQDWTLFAGKLGLGWTFPMSDCWKLRPSVGFALSRIENEASYNDLAEEILKPLIEGMFVNWDAWAATSAASLTALHERELGDVSLDVRGRYTYAYTDAFDATDPFQERSDSSQFVSLRADVEGPTPWELYQRPIRWMTFGSYATFLQTHEDALGFDHVFEVGVGLRFPLPKIADDVLLSGGLLFGADVSGSTLGLSFSF